MPSGTDERTNKRRYPRIEIRTRVNCVGGHVFSSDYTRNLSPVGMCMEGIHPIPPGTIVTLEFTLPGIAGTFTAKARVIWATGVEGGSGASMGIEFLDLAPHAMEYLRNYSPAKTP